MNSQDRVLAGLLALVTLQACGARSGLFLPDLASPDAHEVTDVLEVILEDVRNPDLREAPDATDVQDVSDARDVSDAGDVSDVRELVLDADVVETCALRDRSGLNSIRIVEVTSGTRELLFGPNDPVLGTRRQDPLNSGNYDFQGASTEYYDFYYSDEEGVFSPDGCYLTITAVFAHGAPAGGGANIAAAELVYTNAQRVSADRLLSYELYGDNAREETLAFLFDANPSNHTTLGSTIGFQRLRLTLGFPQAP